MRIAKEFFVVVDVETAGPVPAKYSLLSIGAATLEFPRASFYIELQPEHEEFTEEAFSIHGLSHEYLKEKGLPAKEAMKKFAEWVENVTPVDRKPTLVAFNAPFDWMFISDYFHRHLDENPFGYKALDMKAYFMGMKKISWEGTSHKFISEFYKLQEELNHHALEDALAEVALFQLLLEDVGD